MNYRKSFWLMWALCVVGLLLLYLFVAVGHIALAMPAFYACWPDWANCEVFPLPLLRQTLAPAGRDSQGVSVLRERNPLTDTDRPGQMEERIPVCFKQTGIFLMLEKRGDA